MFAKTLSTVAVVLASASAVSAQTSTSCNPLKSTCHDDTAFGKDQIDCDFTKGACDIFTAASGTDINYSSKGAAFVIKSEGDSPTISTSKYLFFGQVEVVAQAAPGKGIVTSSVLQSDDLDEIDWEWLGGDNTQVQTNYFYKGDTSTYDREADEGVATPVDSYHTYTVTWTSKSIVWSIDNVAVRTLANNNDGKFPQTPMQVKIGTWDGGAKTEPSGTVEWAGGYTDMNDAPFTAYFKSVKIVDYAGTDGPDEKGAEKYHYEDHSGDWQKIKVIYGSGSSDSSSKGATTSVKISAPKSTKAPSKTQAAASHTAPMPFAKPTSTSKSSKSKSGSKAGTKTGSSGGTTLATASKPTKTSSGSGSGSSKSGSGSGSGSSKSGSSSGSGSGSSSASTPSSTPSSVSHSGAVRVTGTIGAAFAALFAGVFLL